MTTKQQGPTSSLTSTSTSTAAHNNINNNINITSKIASLFNGLGGLNHGSLFQISDAIDMDKPPGMTSYDRIMGGPPQEQTPWKTIKSILTLQAFLYSPNVTWFLLALIIWTIVPYRIDKNMDNENWWNTTLQERLIVNHIMVFGYAGFWHVSLYWFQMAKRPFAPKPYLSKQPMQPDKNTTTTTTITPFPWPKVCHNIFYTWLGVLQWTITEMALLYCYQMGKLPYDDDDNTHMFISSFTMTLILCILIPPFRDFHFYFAHRWIHTKFLYKYIHFVHHRNTTDIEPFSGLTMHPFEHLYYFSGYGLLFLLTTTTTTIHIHHPFVLFWMGFHTLIAPFASHSGFEDHFSADLHHYLHHRYYECNYGAGIPFDCWFGTYRDKLKPQHANNNSSSTVATTTTTTTTKTGSVAVVVVVDPKATLFAWKHGDNNDNNKTLFKKLNDLFWAIAPENSTYLVSCLGMTILIFTLSVVSTTIKNDNEVSSKTKWQCQYPHLTAILVSTLPCWMAWIFYNFIDTTTRQQKQQNQKSPLAPFQKDSTISQIVHFGLGFGFAVLPVTYLLDIVLLQDDSI